MPDDSLLEVVCDFRRSFRLVFMVSVLAIVILIPSALAVDSGSGTYVVTMVQLVTFVVLLTVSGSLMIICGRRAETS